MVEEKRGKGAMLGYLFGFNARIGRLRYFLSTFALGVATAIVMFAILGAAVRNGASALALNTALKSWPTLIAFIFFTWLSLTLQSMRFRDIGWDPVCVIPTWIALLVVDHLVAVKIPAWSLSHDNPNTVVGALVHFGLVLALLFWPSADPHGPVFDEPVRKRDMPSRRVSTTPAADRIARISASNR